MTEPMTKLKCLISKLHSRIKLALQYSVGDLGDDTPHSMIAYRNLLK